MFTRDCPFITSYPLLPSAQVHVLCPFWSVFAFISHVAPFLQFSLLTRALLTASFERPLADSSKCAGFFVMKVCLSPCRPKSGGSPTLSCPQWAHLLYTILYFFWRDFSIRHRYNITVFPNYWRTADSGRKIFLHRTHDRTPLLLSPLIWRHGM
jgi:hypothetical protein